MSIQITVQSFDAACTLYQRTWPEKNVGEQEDCHEGDNNPQPGREPSLSEKVEKFGREWVVTREKFLISLADSLISTIHCFVLALIDSGFALIKGEAKDDVLNKKAIQSWSDTGLALRYAGQSLVGFGAPSFAIKIHNFINEKMKPAEDQQSTPEAYQN